MKRIIINENQKGLLFKNGKFQGVLDAGKYFIRSGKSIEPLNLKDEIQSKYCSLELLLKNKAVASSASVVEVGDMQVALHFVNGQFDALLCTGKHAFWSAVDKHVYKVIDISETMVSDDVPEYVFAKIPGYYYKKVEVSEYQKAIVYFNRRLFKVLDAGTYYFWNNGVKVDVDYIDTRLIQLNVSGQELLTLDKVTIRVSFVCNYRITDCVKLVTEVCDYTEQLHVAVQLSLREYVGKMKLDDILENKTEMSDFVFKSLKEKEKDLYIEITDAGVKDIILPGEIRDIMNTVLIAEKRAQANVITRREEVASTRSLLNTAKLMDENQTLYKLKELEFIERICENVGNISISGSGDALSQLAGLLGGKTRKEGST